MATETKGPPTAAELREAHVQLEAVVAQRIAEGFDPVEQIAEEALDYFEGSDTRADAVPLEEVEEMVEGALEAHLEAQEAWPVPTDCDRLDRAFANLERKGVVARQNWTCCQNCGHSEIGEEIEAEKQKGRAPKGYAFYHRQDTEGAAAGGGLYLAFGAVGAEQVEVGRIVAETIAAEGLKVTWDGTVSKRIHVSLDWKKRRR